MEEIYFEIQYQMRKVPFTVMIRKLQINTPNTILHQELTSFWYISGVPEDNIQKTIFATHNVYKIVGPNQKKVGSKSFCWRVRDKRSYICQDEGVESHLT